MITLLVISLFVAGATLGLSYYLMLRGNLVTVPPENVIVVAKGALTEFESRLPQDAVNKVPLLPQIAKQGDAPLVAREMASYLFLDNPDPHHFSEPPPLRGIDEHSAKIHGARMLTGSLPAPNSLDVIVGKRVAERFSYIRVGHVFDLPGGPGKVSGIFTVGGGPYDDEFWTWRAALELHQKKRWVNSMTVVAKSAADAERLIEEINNSKQFDAQAATVAAFRSNSAGLDSIARVVILLLVLLSVVATFAITTTMAAAVAIRMSELAALAAIGIRRSSLAKMVVIESALLGLVGAVLGALISVGVAALVGSVPLGKAPIPVSVSTTAVGICLALGVLAGLTGAIGPAISVRRMDIIGMLR